MAHYTITLTPECEDLLKGWRKNDGTFNFSKFIQECMLGNDTLLTKEQLALKIKVAKLEAEKAVAQLTHLENVMPVVEEKAEIKEKRLADDTENSIKTLRRILKDEGVERFNEVMPFHERITGMEKWELEKAVGVEDTMSFTAVAIKPKLEDKKAKWAKEAEEIKIKKAEKQRRMDNLNKQEAQNGTRE